MQFTKGHGTGNDFVILPDPDNQLDLTPGVVAALCDRRRGLGGDGVLRVVRAAKHPEGVTMAGEAEWFMDYWNADGSFAEMCGNGARVFVRYLVATGLATPDGEAPLPVATRAGVVRAVVTTDAVAVEMRRPRLYDTATATLGGLTLPGTAVDVGNPHLVCALPAGLELTGLDLTRAPDVDATVFPAGVNVEFTALGEPVDGADGHVLMRVYERGSAETLSCGTGACAVAAVALRDAGRDTGVMAVDVPGGRLSVTIADDSCWLAGPAALVATGEVDPTALTTAA
ncbi:diaminopimelate epimerase [Micromonospora sp. NPDC049497]|uniref:diaminopimelate epimerase n=1 Tax=Micromonospora sp. NPDC049497 TaxID=3364273 RepID=UPI00379526E5